MSALLHTPLFWLSAGLVLILLELLLPGVYLLWIGLGALLVAVPAYLFENWPLYVYLIFLVVFVAISVWLGMRIQKKAERAPKTVNVGLQDYVGMEVQVIQGCTQANGAVRISLAGTTYPAKSQTPIQAGQYATIVAVHRDQLIVSASAEQ